MSRSKLGFLFGVLTFCGTPGQPAQGRAQQVFTQVPEITAFSEAPAKPTLQIAAPASPLSLTASDGTGLALTRFEANAVIEQPLALTELHLIFKNPQDRVIEGNFRIVLPPRASISRFAMAINGNWQEGEVVERQAARRAYEDFLHRRQDPALLEQQAGNEFAARIFPIPARGEKEIIIAYSEELLNTPYRIALQGLPEVGSLDLRARHGSALRELHEHNVQPHADFVVAGSERGEAALRNGELTVARLTPVAETTPELVESLFILVDTSASRTLERSRQAALVRNLIARLPEKTPVSLWAFDQTAVRLFSGTALAAIADKALQTLETRRSLGASNLQAALSEVVKSTQAHRGLLITDGVATAGPDDRWSETLAAARAAGVERLDAIALGGIRDDALLGRLVQGGLAKIGLVIDGQTPAEQIAHKLNRSTRSGIVVDVPGATWFWPKTLNGVQPGEDVLVYADLPADRPLRITLDGHAAGGKTARSAPRALIERAAVGAHIQALLDERERTQNKAIDRQVVALSTQFRVLCPLTALLVLETEADYARFQIDRKALSSILSVGPDGVQLIDRRGPAHKLATLQRPTRRAPRDGARDEAKNDDAKDKGPSPDKASASEGAPSRREAAKTMDEDRPAPAASASARPSASPSVQPSMERSVPRAAMAAPAAAGESISSVAADAPSAPPPPMPQISPYTGDFARVMALLKKDPPRALDVADRWLQAKPGDVMALIALGEALEALGDVSEASRAYGSLIDLFPARADMRRFAGERLERLSSSTSAAELAVDTYRKAVAQRPDHPSSHRLLAFALVKQGDLPAAFAVIETALRQDYPFGRFAGAQRVLSEDLGLIAEVWLHSQPGAKSTILARLEKAGGVRESSPSLRFVLTWETDANDVDFHIIDGQGGHAYYGRPQLASGGALYADVTTGYGPECFTIREPRQSRAHPYKLQAHYYSRGPMGYGMGKLQIVDHDGQGHLRFEERPFVVMQDHAFLDLGTVGTSLAMR